MATQVGLELSGGPTTVVEDRCGKCCGRLGRPEHLDEMIRRGTAYVQLIVDELNDGQIVNGLDFFTRITEVVDGWQQSSSKTDD